MRIQNRRKGKRKEERRLDLALQMALDLLPSDVAEGTELRLVTLLSGRPTLGVELNVFDGNDDEFEIALQHKMRSIGVMAAERKIVLDFFCFAAIHGFAAAALQAAASASGGGLVLSAMHGLSPHEHIVSVFRFITVRAFAACGEIEARTDRSLALKHVIGPAIEGAQHPPTYPKRRLRCSQNMSIITTFPIGTGDGRETFNVPSVERKIGFGLYFEVQDEDARPKRFLQLVSTYKDLNVQADVVRCITFSIDVTDSEDVFAHSVDAVTSASMLAKRIVRKAFGYSQGPESKVAKEVESIAGAIVEGSIGGMGSARAIVRLLFELRRGVLLGRQLHEDDALCLRAMLCSAAPELTARLMAPRLLHIQERRTELPPSGDRTFGDIDACLFSIGFSSTEVRREHDFLFLADGEANTNPPEPFPFFFDDFPPSLSPLILLQKQVPCEQQSLSSDALFAMDAGTEVFIWQGKHVSWHDGKVGDYCRSILLTVASQRLPPAQVRQSS